MGYLFPITNGIVIDILVVLKAQHKYWCTVYALNYRRQTRYLKLSSKTKGFWIRTQIVFNKNIYSLKPQFVHDVNNCKVQFVILKKCTFVKDTVL